MTGDINCKTVNSQLNSPLNLAVLNVCGLKTRSLYPEFQELISDYDMFCVAETKLDFSCLRLGLSWFYWWVSFAPEFLCCYFCESSCLFYLSFNFDFYVSKIMHL